MKVFAPQNIHFPVHAGWLSTRTVGPDPDRGRVLVEIRGHSGHSSWPAGLCTAPAEDLVVKVDQYGYTEEVYLRPGWYCVERGTDRRGQEIVRIYHDQPDSQPEMIAFSVNGHVVEDVSNAITVLKAEGHSRTSRHGSRWSLIAAPVGSTVAVEPYGSRRDPQYYRIGPDGPVLLGETDAVISPSEW